ncbi:MAG: NAD(P)H-dependent oxidoreductase [Bacteroidia bacterium]
MKNILIINGHPNPDSYNYALAEAYQKGAQEAAANVTHLKLAVLDFDPNLRYGHQKELPLEADLQMATQQIQAADHLVWLFPLWWYSYPALMKGFIDRVFLSGVAFKYQPNKLLPQKLLKGKSARIIITADTPYWYYRFFMKSPATQQLKKGTLEFSGISPVKVTYIGPIRNASSSYLTRNLQSLEALGRQLK